MDNKLDECVIFDCDGTLVDSEYLCNLGLEIELRRYGINAPAADLMKKFRGWKLARICEDIELEHRISLAGSFVVEYRKVVDALFEEHLRPVCGVKEVLANLNLPVCVASSGPPEKIEKALAITGLSQYFKGKIYSSYLIRSWKPDPGLFLYAAREMGVLPSNCHVVEDSKVGIQAALAAGMRPYWYGEETDDSVADGVIRFCDMVELPNLLSITRRCTGAHFAPMI